MIARLVEMSLVQRILLCALGLTLLFGGLYSFQLLDIIAYPDPSPPMVELITQNPGWSAEEIERQITIPIEVALTGMPGLTDVRSLSIFGLSDIKVYFDFGTDIFRDRQEVLNRLAAVDFPLGVQPVLVSLVGHRRDLSVRDDGRAGHQLDRTQDHSGLAGAARIPPHPRRH